VRRARLDAAQHLFPAAQDREQSAFPRPVGASPGDRGRARRSGIDPGAARRRWRITREVYVSDSRDQAIADIRERMQESYDYILRLGLGAVIKRDRAMPDEALTMDWIIENMPWIIGSPRDRIRQLHELREEVGAFGCLLINQRDWVTADKWKRSIELFARYVIPHFRARENPAYRRSLAEAAWAGAA
jgi:limonene 1,2-monooxygenase